MKHIPLFTFTFTFGLHLSLLASVPVPWTVDMRRAQPATFEAYQGETLDFKAALMLDGKPFEAPSNYSFFWQTNGMGSTYWSVPCIRTFEHSEHSNILYATWSPTNDVGAKVYNCFIGQPGTIYHAAFQLRLRPSPGALPNELPLPQKVIDFAKVTVLNPPWESGGGGGVKTNAVIDIIHDTVSGSARPLPKYLHERSFDDSYPDEAQEYYRSRGNGKTDGGCSAVRSGGYLYRNFDFPFDDRAEFVVRMSAGPNRFASVGVAQVGTNLTEQMVTSGKPEYSHLYKWLPGATVDGINENGVACNINVVDGEPYEPLYEWGTNGDIHPLGAVRWVLDNATSAEMAATNLAKRISFPKGWTQDFHYMVADEKETWVIEDGQAKCITKDEIISGRKPLMTNYRVVDPFGYWDLHFWKGPGRERIDYLDDEYGTPMSITNVWYTNAYRRETNPPWVSDLREVLAYTNAIFDAWAAHPKEYFRGKTNNGIPWWQTVHTSVYDITNRTLRVAVQEQDDWYTFAIPSAGGGIKEETDPTATAKANAAIAAAGCLMTNDQGVALLPGVSVGHAQYAEEASNSQYADYASVAGKSSLSESLGNDSGSFDYDTAMGWFGSLFEEVQTSIPKKIEAATNGLVSASNPAFSNAVNAVTETTISREVSSAINTYIDGETGVEYVGKFYGDSLYYVPTGNVYPPNN